MHPKLEQLLHSSALPQSLLLVADSAEQLKQEALQFTHSLLNISELPDPDFFLLSPEGKSLQHSIEAMRQFKDEVYKPPFQRARKLFVILDADRMPQVSANALLKVFEEPLPTSYILLCSTNPGRMLPTILSRCQTLKLELKEEAIALPEEVYSFFGSFDRLSLLDRFKHIDFMTEWLEKKAEVPKNKLEEKDLTVQQKEQLEKEQEAQTAAKMAALLTGYFHEWSSWVRDLHLLSVKGNRAQLGHKAHEKALLEQWQRGSIPSLDNTLQAVKQAKISFERFTPVPTVLFDLWSEMK